MAGAPVLAVNVCTGSGPSFQAVSAMPSNWVTTDVCDTVPPPEVTSKATVIATIPDPIPTFATPGFRIDHRKFTSVMALPYWSRTRA